MVTPYAMAFALLAACKASPREPAPREEPPAGAPPAPSGTPAARPVKALIVSMFGPEAKVWVDRMALNEAIPVKGLSPDYPEVHCNARSRGVCNVVTGMGHANAAASVAALVYSGVFDLTKAYVLVAGIAGIDPKEGTLGSATWVRYLVDVGLSWELDAREIPRGWKSGYLGINTKGPLEKPPLDYRTEVFQLDEALLQRALRDSQGVVLEDAKAAAAARARYRPRFPKAAEPPRVIQCDTASSDTWFGGAALGERAEVWTKRLTDGKGHYCTTQQEDNATYEVLKRAAAAGLVDLSRVAILRTGSDFDRPYPGQTAADCLMNYASQGGFAIALANLFNAGAPFIEDVTTNGP